jgi:hypothetical protein
MGGALRWRVHALATGANGTRIALTSLDNAFLVATKLVIAAQMEVALMTTSHALMANVNAVGLAKSVVLVVLIAMIRQNAGRDYAGSRVKQLYVGKRASSAVMAACVLSTHFATRNKTSARHAAKRIKSVALVACVLIIH